MPEPTPPMPRLWGLPPGVDYPGELVAGLLSRLDTAPPEMLAATEIFVNTRRMRRRLVETFARRGALLLPRIRLLAEIGRDPAFADLPPPVAPLRRRLELARLVERLLDHATDLAPRSAAFDLADSLAGLLDEMQGEGVPPERLRGLDVGGHSAHWARTLAFLELVFDFADPAAPPDAEARQRLCVSRLAETWRRTPPEHPVIVAGSTGSRGATALLMQAVARLPQGAVVLPGVDFALPASVWDALEADPGGEDHPQYRFLKLARALGLPATAIRPWTGTEPPSPARNRLVSLALRPAPVTDAWLAEGPALGAPGPATEGLSLVVAPTPRMEALAIALRLRQAAEAGQRAALITPDRMLTRQVTATLARWGLEPDDSAGEPLGLSPPGRFLRQVAQLIGHPPGPETLIALLKHPLTHSGQERGPHLRRLRELELHLREQGAARVEPEMLRAWAATRQNDPAAQGWADWLNDVLARLAPANRSALETHLAAHIAAAEALAAGPGASGCGELWEKAAGAAALELVTDFRDAADAGGELAATDYPGLFRSVLARGQDVRDPIQPHPGIMIWGTLEARVQGADLVILGALVEGVWPALPESDPWLSRAMRDRAGLRSPERRIGLSAHDFQQAVAATEVVLTRAARDSEAPLVPARWLNRLTGLLTGLGDGGRAALTGMLARGEALLDLAGLLDRPETTLPSIADERLRTAPRPAPAPPAQARPRRMSVTQVQSLIRDPYAVYARQVLRLKRLSPLRPEADALLRGTALHEVLERFMQETRDALPEDAAALSLLSRLSGEVLGERVPFPAVRRLWQVRLERLAPWFVASEARRRDMARPELFEPWGSLDFRDPDFTLFGKADRIDRDADGGLTIYDYKTGSVPTGKRIRHFDRQLPLLGLIAEAGGFSRLAPGEVRRLAYLAISGDGAETEVKVSDMSIRELIDDTESGLKLLMRAYLSGEQGFASRRAVESTRHEGDYDHLARYGEWSEADLPQTMVLS